MNLLFIALLLVSSIAGSSAVGAPVQCRSGMLEARHQQITGENWELQNEHGGIKVYNREVPGSGVREVLALATINLPASRLFDTVSDYAHYRDFMPYVKRSEVQSPINDHKKIRVYQELDLPWPISNRYYTIELTRDTTQANLGHYSITWTLAHEEIPKETGVQLKVNNGYWQFCTVGENMTFLEYYIHTDPGGMLPQWAVNQANNKAVPDVIHALQHRATSVDYKR